MGCITNRVVSVTALIFCITNRVVSVTAFILTFFVSAIILCYIVLPLVYGQINTNATIPLGKQITSARNSTTVDLTINPGFTFFNDTGGLPSYWNDPLKRCRTTFICRIKFTDGWNDNVSFSLSTTNNTNQTWSSIYGKEIDVKPKERYQLVSHMKLNDWAKQSHVPLEGFDETSGVWHRLVTMSFWYQWTSQMAGIPLYYENSREHYQGKTGIKCGMVVPIW